jgi:hypothetical protein
MGNCCSDYAGARTAIGGTAGSLLNQTNDAVDNFFKSRGYHGLFSQIEVKFLLTFFSIFFITLQYKQLQFL